MESFEFVPSVPKPRFPTADGFEHARREERAAQRLARDLRDLGETETRAAAGVGCPQCGHALDEVGATYCLRCYWRLEHNGATLAQRAYEADHPYVAQRAAFGEVEERVVGRVLSVR